MRFSFEEAELINTFFEGLEKLPTLEEVVDELEQAKINTAEQELVEIATDTINKIKDLSNKSFNDIFSNLPIDTYTIY